MKASSRAGLRLAGVIVVALILLALPQLFSNNYQVHLLNLAGIGIIFALSLNIVLGFAGQISLGHAAFFGVGAYATTLLSRDGHVPVFLAMLLAMLIAGAFGLGVGVQTLRIGGHYLAMVTIAFGQIASVIFLNASWLTGGYNGLRGIPPFGVGDLRFAGERSSYYVILVMVALMLGISITLKRSALGRSMLAVREDEAAAQALGVNTMVVKIQAFVLSSAFAGLAGAVYAHWAGFIAPEAFTIDWSITVFTMVLVGGVGSVPGVVLGAILITLLPEYLRVLKDYYRLIYGVILIVFIIFLPGGVASMATHPSIVKGLARIRGRSPSKGVESAKRSNPAS